MVKEISLLDKYIGHKIKMKRISLGLSQTKLGEALKVTFQQVQKYEAGSNRIPVSKLYALKKLFNVSMDYFCDGYDKRSSNFKKVKENEYLNNLIKKSRSTELLVDFNKVAKKFSKVKYQKDRKIILDIIGCFIRNRACK